MLYNNERKEWEHSGGSSGISRVHVYHHPVNNTYRIVGRKVQDHTVCYKLKTYVMYTFTCFPRVKTFVDYCAVSQLYIDQIS